MSTRTSSLSIRTTSPLTTSPSLEGPDRRVVVGHEHAVLLDQQVVGGAVARLWRRGGRRFWRRLVVVSGVDTADNYRRPPADDGRRPVGVLGAGRAVPSRARCPAVAPSAAPSAHRSPAHTTSSSAARVSRASRWPASSPAPRRGCSSSTATRSASARPRPALRPPGGCGRSAWRTRSARPSAISSSTPRIRPRGCACRGPSRPSITAGSANSCGHSATPSSRRRRWTAARARRCTPTGATSTRRWSSTALGWRRMLRRRRLPAARRPALARARGAPRGGRRRARDLDRPRLRARRLRLELSRRRRGPGRGRLVRPPPPRQGADGSPGVRPRPRAGPLPGQLDPPPPAPGGRRRHLLRRRLGRALPAADRRGNPHRVLLRHRLRARAARRGRRLQVAGAGAGRLRLLLGLSPVEVRGDAAGPAAGAADRAAGAGGDAAGHGEARLRRLVVRPLPADRAPGVRRVAAGPATPERLATAA